jgi:AraC family transcriptional regulator of adaptative response/methylated-DNA-[protein]-cysteine methyltransferase
MTIHASAHRAPIQSTARAGAPSTPSIPELAIAIGDSPLGCVLVAGTARGIAAVLLGDGREALLAELRERFPTATLAEGETMREALAEVVRLIESPARSEPAARLQLDPRGTTFQRQVWDALREIPAGSTATYAEIARRIGRPTATRAVAAACAANPIALLVPCHRVVARDGSLSGYRWGVERKRALLERERAR